MIVIAFILFAALVLAWLAAPGQKSAPKSAPATPTPAIRTSEATA